MTAAGTVVVESPGVYAMDFETYLADPVPGGSLSTSGAKVLLNKCPAIFQWKREHGRPDKAAFDEGHAAHTEVLGDGMEVAVIPDAILSSSGSTNTKAAKAFIAEARARGAVPIKSDVAASVRGMGDALRAHPLASKLLNPERGTPEQSLFWLDDGTGVWRRARLDALPHPAAGRMVIADYKSCENAHPSACAKAIDNYSYHQQGAAYIDAVKALGLTDDAALLLIFQEKSAPYLITVAEMSVTSLRIGRERNSKALEIFKRCTETNEWPGYSSGIELLDVPTYAEYRHEELMAS